MAKENPDTTDLFQKEYLAEVWELQSQMEDAELLFENRVYTVDYFCYKPVTGKGCFISSPMDYWKMNITKLEDDPDIKYTAQCTQQVAGEEIVCSDRNEIPIIREVVFGGIECLSGSTTGCEACKITAKMLSVTFLLNNDPATKEGAERWETHVFEDKIHAFNTDDSKLLKVHYLAERSISDELNHETDDNILYVVFSYIAMFIYVSIAIGTFPSKLHTRFLVGLGGIAIVVSSAGVSIGVTAWGGLDMSMISVEVIPFLILAIGVDNMFIISTAFESAKKRIRKKTGETPEIEEALGMALADVAPSITAAAFSEIMAFVVGAATDVPALTDFCIQAAVAVGVDYMLQLTVFVAFLSLDERRTRSGRLDCMPCFDLLHRPPEPDRYWIKSLVRNYYTPALFHPISELMIGVIFVAVVLLSIGGYSHLNLGLNPQITTISGSNLYQYFEEYSKWSDAGPVAYIVFKNVNYTNAHNRDIMDRMADALAQMKKTVQPPVYSWLKNFNQFTVDGGTWAAECNTTDIQFYDFNTQLRMFLNVKIESHCCKKYGICGEQYEKDIIFGPDGNVLTSRYRFQHTALSNQKIYVDSYRDARHAVSTLADELVPYLDSDANMADYSTQLSVDWSSSADPYTNQDNLAFAYSLFYVYYSQYDFIRGVCFQNFLLSCGAVFVAVELLTNFYCALLVTLFVAGTTWGMIGTTYLWNQLSSNKFVVEINAISVVNMITCAGFAVEFCVHISTKFLKAKGTRKERSQKALVNMGSTVITGIVITKLIGVSVLGLAPSMIFNLYYFRMYFCIFFLGVFHGLAFQPVVLKYIGPPHSQTFSAKTKAKPLTNGKRHHEETNGGFSKSQSMDS